MRRIACRVRVERRASHGVAYCRGPASGGRLFRACGPRDDRFAVARDGSAVTYGFLSNSASQAERASSGVATARLPVKSKVFAGAKNVQVFAASFDGIRTGIGCAHSNRADVSKKLH
jgi:hypothetical protein